MLEYEGCEGGMAWVAVNGERLRTDDGETWYLPKRLLSGLRVDELPDFIDFMPCQWAEDGFVMVGGASLRLRRTGAGAVHVVFEDYDAREHWDDARGLESWMQVKRGVVSDREALLCDVLLESCDDDGDCVCLAYSADFEAETVELAVQLAEQVAAEVDGAVELLLGGQPVPNTPPSSEQEFTLKTVLPLLRMLGFRNIKYNHGSREFGRDVVFARVTEFDELEHWGAQVKHGDVSGGAGSEVNKLIGQAEDAFSMPFYSIYTRRQERISRLVIIVSGAFTENARQKICDGIQSSVLRNNLVFIDGDKISTLAERFRGRGRLG